MPPQAIDVIQPKEPPAKPRRVLKSDRCRKCGGKLKRKVWTTIAGLPVTELTCPRCEGPQPKPRRKSAQTKARPAYDPEIGAEIYRLLVGWRSLSPAELDSRVHQIRRLATRCHLGPPVWAAIDKMRARLRTGVHARYGNDAA